MDPTLEIAALPRRGAREDFSVRVLGPGDTDYRFRLSITYTALSIWQASDGMKAAEELAKTLVRSHGTASAFPDSGFWFDSYNSADTVGETCNRVLEKGWTIFQHPSARESLGAVLFDALQALDEACLTHYGRLFLKPLDILFEPSQALEDLEGVATDHPHFIYRVCILSGIVDRFDFDTGEGSLNGLSEWLGALIGKEMAEALLIPFRMVKRLRRQYPIHELFERDSSGELRRRSDVVAAEVYFGLGSRPAKDWRTVLEAFTQAVAQISRVLGPGSA